VLTTGVRYRRCSERQGGGEPLVSEWFVSEGRLDPLGAYRSPPHRWRCRVRVRKVAGHRCAASKSYRTREQIRDRSGIAAAIVGIPICLSRVPPDQEWMERLVTTRIRVSVPHSICYGQFFLYLS
jgi:hypothetical protein